MLVSLLNQLITTLAAALPRFFVRGVPFLVMAIVLAAVADSRMPARARRAPTR